MTGLLTTSGQQHQDWSAAYRLYAADRVDTQPLFAVVRHQIEQAGAPDQPLIVALDDSILRKRGRHIPGTAWRPDPLGAPFQINFVWAQRVLQLAAVWPEGNDGAARTVPIDFTQAPTSPRPRRSAPVEVWAAYREQCKQTNINRQALHRVEQLQRQRQAEGATRTLWLTVDGRFTNRTFLKNLSTEVVTIGRIRGDARLYEAVEPSPSGASGGRPRYYGRPLPTPEQLRQDQTTPWQTMQAYAAGKRHAFRIKTLSPVRWRGTGAKRALQLIVIAPLQYRLNQNSRLLYRKPAYLICTDPTVPVPRLLQAYLWRWGIEVNFRDEKTLLGEGAQSPLGSASACYCRCRLCHAPVGGDPRAGHNTSAPAVLAATTFSASHHLRHTHQSTSLRPVVRGAPTRFQRLHIRQTHTSKAAKTSA